MPQITEPVRPVSVRVGSIPFHLMMIPCAMQNSVNVLPPCHGGSCVDFVNVNPIVTFFALLVGARIAGLLGIFLAVPIAGLLVSLLEIDELKGEA